MIHYRTTIEVDFFKETQEAAQEFSEKIAKEIPNSYLKSVLLLKEAVQAKESEATRREDE